MLGVRKRFGEEEWDIRQFVQPSAPAVVRIASSLPADRFVEAAWEWVLNNIKYPPGPLDVADRHYREAFVRPGTNRPLISETAYDFWSFPAETVACGYGDCEDASFVLASILRNRLPETEVFVTVGQFGGMGHAWVTVRDLVLETTPLPGVKRYTASPERHPYIPLLRFNDRLVVGWKAPAVLMGVGYSPRKAAAIAALQARLTRKNRRPYAGGESGRS